MTRPQINVTPLIDVLLVLLIIFMIITPTKPSAFKTKVPQEPDPNALKATVHPDTLIVIIDDNSGLTLNKEAGLGFVDEPQKMIDRLRGIFDERTRNYSLSSSGDGTVTRHVFIKAPKRVKYGSVAKVVDAVKMSGAEPIALQVDHLN